MRRSTIPMTILVAGLLAIVGCASEPEEPEHEDEPVAATEQAITEGAFCWIPLSTRTTTFVKWVHGPGNRAWPLACHKTWRCSAKHEWVRTDEPDDICG